MSLKNEGTVPYNNLGSEPTTAEKLRAIPWSITGNIANTLFNQLVFFGSGYVLFLNEIAFTKTQIGVLLSLFSFLGAIAIFITPLIERLGYKRTTLQFWTSKQVAAAFLLFTPWALQVIGMQGLFLFIAGITLVFAFFRTVSETAHLSWSQEYIPNSIRGKYSALAQISMNTMAILAVAGAGVVIDSSDHLNRFILLFAIGLVFGFGSIWAFKRVPGGFSGYTHQPYLAQYQNIIKVVRDRNFLVFIVGVALVVLATGPVGSFLPLYMEEQIGLTPGNVVWLQIGTLLGGVISGYIWGWAADRYGSKPVMLSGIFIFFLLPILWFMLPRHSPYSFGLALAIAFLNGIGTLGWAVGLLRLFYVQIIPPTHKGVYMGAYYSWVSVVSGISALVGGRVLDLAGNFSGEWLIFHLDAYSWLFFGGSCFALISLVAFRMVKSEGRLTTSQFVGLFFRGNLIRAAEALISFHGSKDEQRVVESTARMGDARSPLTVDELLVALSDPRFYVRYEALVAIARHGPDDRLLAALVRTLNEGDPDLSVLAAWALGRMKDPRAIAPLRAGLASPYRSIRRLCARSLAVLDDHHSRPVLLDLLKQETDLSLQVAYATSLGKLQEKGALPHLFRLLRHHQNEESRLELSLAIAREVGDEHQFIQLLQAVQDDPGTACSQAMMTFQRKHTADLEANPALAIMVKNAIETMAKGDLGSGVTSINQLIEEIGTIADDDVSAAVLADGAQRLKEFGFLRKEYLVLTLHAMIRFQIKR